MKRTEYEVPKVLHSTYMETARLYTDGKGFYVRLKGQYQSVKGWRCEEYIPKQAYEQYITKEE